MPTVRISDANFDKAEEGAVDLTLIRRKPARVSEVVNYVLEKYLDEGLKDFISEEKERKRQQK